MAQSKAPATKSAALEWTETDAPAVDVIRGLAMDAVEAAGSGHPGTAMSLAPAAYLLFQRLLRHDPTDPTGWAGTASSCPAGTPASRSTSSSSSPATGSPSTTSSCCGSGAAGRPVTRSTGTPSVSRPRPARSARASATPSAWRWPPAASAACSTPRPPPARACSTTRSGASPPTATSRKASPARPSCIAGHQQLGNLVLLYDDNHISIEGDTEVAFSEDVARALRGLRLARPAGRGRHDVNRSTRRSSPRATRPPAELHLGAQHHRLAGAARAEHRQGARLGARRRRGRRTKKVLGFAPDVDVLRARTTCSNTRARSSTAAAPRTRRGRGRTTMGAANPDGRELDRIAHAGCPRAGTRRFPTSPARSRWRRARRRVRCINAIAPSLPELWGGSADLAESNNTEIEGADSFLPDSHGGSPRTAASCTSASASTPWARS